MAGHSTLTLAGWAFGGSFESGEDTTPPLGAGIVRLRLTHGVSIVLSDETPMANAEALVEALREIGRRDAAREEDEKGERELRLRLETEE